MFLSTAEFPGIQQCGSLAITVRHVLPVLAALLVNSVVVGGDDTCAADRTYGAHCVDNHFKNDFHASLINFVIGQTNLFEAYKASRY
ncbi:hypothetical protein BV898_07171 [Hypsibius exemplaris]|uniref:Uncharacterized protein n=1 Tax=Hypsibius exemplaris TaxID=2072580 RepID=A0A1W0WU62_HYPEX|nr:hypothetical protein BV898_07171 [Hypsibius exemplaris]